MESLELRIFLDVAHTKSITKSAEHLGYVQSNITAHIKKLEAELNTTLFIRHSKGVTLTNDGEQLLYQAESVMKMFDQIPTSFQHRKQELRIGASQTIAGYVLPQCMVAYGQQFPNTSISIITKPIEELSELLAANEIDCIFTNSFMNVPQATDYMKWEEEVLLLAPKACEHLEDIFNYAIITNTVSSCPYRKTLLQWWNATSAYVPNMLEFDTVDAILNCVAKGGGVTLLAKSTMQNRNDIHCFYVEELQTVSIHMWISNHHHPHDFENLRTIINQEVLGVSN